MKTSFSTLILLLTALNLFAQNGEITGNIVNKANQPLSDVNILFKDSSKGTMTDSKGNFKIKNLDAGKYNLVISMIGYKTQKLEVSVKNNQVSNLNTITLEQSLGELNEVVINGQKNKYVEKKVSSSLHIKTPIKELAQNVQVISSDLLDDQQVINMLDGITRNVSGVTLVEHWGHFARVNMRGFRIPAFRNGVNVQDTWGPLVEDAFMIDQIEFVKGPAGFMMASGEPGGFYNVVTKKPVAQPIGKVSLMEGSFGTYRGTLDLGGKLTKNEKLLFRFNALYQNVGTHRDYDDSKRYGIAPSLLFKVTDKTKFLVEFNAQNAESSIGSAYVFAPSDSGFGSLDRDFTFIDSSYPSSDIREVSLLNEITHDFNENWSFKAKYVYMDYNQEGYTIWPYVFEDNGDARRFVSNWDAISQGQYFQTYLSGEFNTGSIKHNVLGGFDFTDKNYWADWFQGDYIDSATQPFNVYNPVYGNVTLPTVNRSVALKNRTGVYTYGNIVRSGYVQDELQFFDNKLRVTLAARYTELVIQGNEDKDTKITPRFGLSYDITPTLTVYGLYDESFLTATGIARPGNTFDPISANDIEGGLKKTFFDGKLKSSLSAYLITKKNIAVIDPNNAAGENFSVQLGEVQSKGIEFDLQGQITPELNAVLNYANTNIEITKDTDPNNIGNRIAGHAKHITNGWLNYNFNERSTFKGFGISLGYQYQIDRSSWGLGADNKSELPDYFRLDGGLSWKNKKVNIKLNINNILDAYLYSGQNYGTYLYWQSEPGVNGRLSVTYNFL